MKTAHPPYDVVKSSERIDAILDDADANYQESDAIPDSKRLTLSNGFNVKCAAVFIDIRGSARLPGIHTRPVLAKLYRAYVSESIAVLNASDKAAEIFIQGDSVGAIFDTPVKANISEVFGVAAKLNSAINVLNWKLERKGYTLIRCGIGMAWGAALMVKAGQRTARISDIVWMGNVVNEAAHLCHKGNRDHYCAVQVSNAVYSSLTAGYQQLLSPVISLLPPQIVNYEGNVGHEGMEAWLQNARLKGKKANVLARFLDDRLRPASVDQLASQALKRL